MKVSAKSWRGICFGSSVGLLLALVFGCGGSSDSSAPAAPVGNAAVRSSSVASYQSLGAGVAYPFAGIAATSPAGSTLHTLALISKQYRSYLIKPTSGSLSLVSQLGLYTDSGVKNGGTDTYHFFTDAAGKDPAGTMTLTSESGSFDYTAYPDTIDLSVDVTAGNLPCKGSAKIIFDGSTGSNTVQGTLNLTKNSEAVSIDLTLSPTLQVTGSITITEASTTIMGTNVKGPLTGNLSVDFTLQPQGYLGTGTLNLTTSSISLTFTSPKGASCSLDSSGNLIIDYTDGTSQTIDNPLSADLLGGGSTTGGNTTTTGSTAGTTGTTAGTTGATAGTTGTTAGTTGTTSGTTGSTGTAGILFNAPVLTTLGNYVVSGWASNKALVAYPTAGGAAYYYTSPTATPTNINLTGAPTDGAIPNSVNSSGVIVGNAGAQLYGDETPVYWSNAASAYRSLKMPSGYTIGYANCINDKGQIVGEVQGQSGYLPVYWSSTTATGTLLSLSGLTNAPQANAINANGQILGFAAQGTNCVWTAPSAKPIVPTCASGYLPNLRAISTFGVAGFESGGPTGTICAIWPSPGFSAKAVGTVTGTSPDLIDAINSTGVAGGALVSGGANVAALWDTKGNAELITAAIPASSPKDTYFNLLAVFDDNSCLLQGYNGIYYLTPK